MGAHAFPKDSKLIRSKDQIEDIAAGAGMNLVPVFAQRSALNVELLKARNIATPTSSSTGTTRSISAASRRRSTPWAPTTRMATPWSWSTACCSRATWPCGRSRRSRIPTAKISHWLASLDRLEAFKPKQLVPSHGPFGDNSIIAGYRAYLTRIRDRSAELKKAGKTQDETIQIITDEMSRAVSGQEPARGRDPRGLQRSAVSARS